jgi:hypothetical protein
LDVSFHHDPGVGAKSEYDHWIEKLRNRRFAENASISMTEVSIGM